MTAFSFFPFRLHFVISDEEHGSKSLFSSNLCSNQSCDGDMLKTGSLCLFGLQVSSRVDDLWLPHRQRLASGHQTLRQPAKQPNLSAAQSDGSHA